MPISGRFFLLLVIGVLFFGNGCREGYSNEMEKSVQSMTVDADEEALYQYWKGNYRRSNVILDAKETPSILDYYLMGRNYYELEEYHDAVLAFSHLNEQSFLTNEIDPILFENYIYYYSSALVTSTVSYSNSVETVSNFLWSMDTNSLYYDDVADVYLYYQYLKTNYQAMTNAQFDSLYTDVGKYFLGETWYVRYILSQYDDATYTGMYPDILRHMDYTELNTRDSVNDAVDIAVDYDLYDEAEDLIEHYYDLFEDKDYYTRNMAIVEYGRGNKTSAINSLTDYCESGDASMKTWTKLLAYLKSNYRYQTGIEKAEEAMAAFPGYFYSQYITFCYKADEFDELYEWYKTKDSSVWFMENYGESVLQVLVMEDADLAKKLIKRYLGKESSSHMKLLSALYDYEDEDYDDAYPYFLDILFDDPFSYEWVIAYRYESELRDDYQSQYDERLSEILSKFDSYSTKKKLWYSINIMEIDPDGFEENIGSDTIEELQSEYHDTIASYFTVTETIPELEELRKDEYAPQFLWNRELENVIENILDEYTSSYKELYQYSYYYRDLFEKLDLYGTVLHRLASYAYYVVGSRQYHVLLPLEVQKELYPLVEFDFIVSNMKGDTNRAMWVMSSYRQESHFRKHVRSWVGAVGFAQVMPYTADSLKKNLGEPDLSVLDFYDNVYLGVVLFRYLFNLYDGNFPFALGAYNGGEGAVNRWKRNYDYDTELWIEAVTYDETRGYIKNIVKNRIYYDLIYDLTGEFFDYADFD